MYEKIFLEQALDELQSLREENDNLRRKLLLYEQLFKDLKHILKEEKHNEERRIRKVH